MMGWRSGLTHRALNAEIEGSNPSLIIQTERSPRMATLQRFKDWFRFHWRRAFWQDDARFTPENVNRSLWSLVLVSYTLKAPLFFLLLLLALAFFLSLVFS